MDDADRPLSLSREWSDDSLENNQGLLVEAKSINSRLSEMNRLSQVVDDDDINDDSHAGENAAETIAIDDATLLLRGLHSKDLHSTQGGNLGDTNHAVVPDNVDAASEYNGKNGLGTPGHTYTAPIGFEGLDTDMPIHTDNAPIGFESLYSLPEKELSKRPPIPPRHIYVNVPRDCNDNIDTNQDNDDSSTIEKRNINTDDEVTTDNNQEDGTETSGTTDTKPLVGNVKYNGSILLDRDGPNEYPTRCIVKDRELQRKQLFDNEFLESFMPCIRRTNSREVFWGILNNEITILVLQLIALITSVSKTVLDQNSLSQNGIIAVTFLEVFSAVCSLALRTSEAWFKVNDEKESRRPELWMKRKILKDKKPTWRYTPGIAPLLKKWRLRLVFSQVVLGIVIIVCFVVFAIKGILIATVLSTNIPLFIGDMLGRTAVYQLRIGQEKIQQDHLKMALLEGMYLLQDVPSSTKRRHFTNSVKLTFYFPSYIDIPRLDQTVAGPRQGTGTMNTGTMNTGTMNTSTCDESFDTFESVTA